MRESSTPVDLKRLPSAMRAAAAESKYAEAVAMYADTDMTMRDVAEKCGVSSRGLSAHIGRYHRPLLMARYGLAADDQDVGAIKIKPPRGQSPAAHRKYRDAIEACGDVAYIEYNITQIGNLFGVDGTALASQLRVHYPDVMPNREKLRLRLGIADNIARGARQSSLDAYAEALQLYRDTDMTMSGVADKCNVSKSGFCQFMRFYHKDVLKSKSARRKSAMKKNGMRKPGTLAGNGQTYGPNAATEAQYAPALDLYRNTSMTIKEICEATGVTDSGFRGYLHMWHRGESLRRRGYEWDGVSLPDLKGTKHFLKSTAAKYAPAIASLKENPRSVAQVASEFKLNPDVFRHYLKTHEPSIFQSLGMQRDSNGKLLKRSSAEKYAKAIQEYATSSDTLKDIARRHGIVYNSIAGYIKRNCPDEQESHRRHVETAGKEGYRST